jgi:hypothetical protein
MKAYNFSLTILLFVGLTILSCNKKTNDQQQSKKPDAIFDATITGAISDQLNFKLVEQMSTESAGNAAYGSSNTQYSFVFQVGTTKQITFYGNGNFANGTYAATDGDYVDYGNGYGFGKFISGSFTISNIELYQEAAGNTSLHWISGSATIVLEDANNPGSQITINCQFSNIYLTKA